MNRTKLKIKNASCWLGDDFHRADILISNSIITDIAILPENEISEDTLHSDKHTSKIHNDTNCVVIDASGLHLLPGLVDMHVHFREPGFSYKETIKSGSMAAARGGFTTVCTMPNLNPAPDSTENLQIQTDIIARESVINILPYACITIGRKGSECVDFETLGKLNIAGFSDDGSGIQNDGVMRKALQNTARINTLLAEHCEVNDLLHGGYIHKGEYAEKHGHRGICSESEWKEVERNVRLAEETGARLHICHISTKESVEIIRNGKKRGVKVTCETAPHYLAFCDNDIKEEGRFKMNPPLRSDSDRQALINGITDGTIDVIATDHAPHSEEEKKGGLEKSAMGVSGIEISFPAIYTLLVKPGIITFGDLIRLMADKPREILQIEGDLIGGLKPGAKANLTLTDLSKEFIVNPSEFVSMGKSTPFEGTRIYGKITHTIVNGKVLKF